ncbi:MAG: hypothetical protein IJ767_04670 [Bacteroidaceae bacterium]|nr:hypothetical protein [Bacteroidaceae bacterium]
MPRTAFLDGRGTDTIREERTGRKGKGGKGVRQMSDKCQEEYLEKKGPSAYLCGKKRRTHEKIASDNDGRGYRSGGRDGTIPKRVASTFNYSIMME